MALAIYGSVLATIVFLWDVIKHIREKPRLRVKVNHRVLLGSAKQEHKLGIDIINIGQGIAHIVASGFELSPPLPNGSMATVFDPQLPKELPERQCHTSYAIPSEVPEERIIYGWARDATGRIWYSKKWPLRVRKPRGFRLRRE